MGIRGGSDRSDLRPLKPDGNVQHDLDAVVVGNHKGQFGGFNIVNPRPGTVHQFGTKRDVLAARGRGWWVADPERDGRPAYDLMMQHASDSGTPIDSSGGLYPEYVHLVTSEENYRRLVQEQKEAGLAQLSPAGLSYLEGGSFDEQETGRGSGKPLATRFATRDHATITQDEKNRVLEYLTPQGIVREEDL